MAVPTGAMSLQLAAFKEMIEATSEWQTWAGPEYRDRIFFHANVIEIEGGGFFYPHSKMPFIVLWTPGAGLVYHSQACFHWAPNLAMLVQDRHRGTDHNDGAIEYLNHLSDLVDQLTALVGNFSGGTVDTGGGLDIREMQLIFEAQRVPPLEQNEDHDFWAATFGVNAGQRT